MKLKKLKKSDILLLVIIALIIIPQTRKPIQMAINKVISQFSPSVIDSSNRETFTFYDFILKDLSGNQINLKDYEGEVIFLNFWATWCPPCIAELPQIQALANDYKDKIKIVLVSNEKPETVSIFLNKKGYNLMSYRPTQDYPKNLNISSIPRTLLINKKGEILIDKKGAANWNSKKIRNLINEMLQ